MDFFDRYAHCYDFGLEPIKYKYYHSLRVKENMINLAKNLSLPEKDIELASCIGILHDIGRFDQYMLYRSFDDFDLDHGDYACELIDKLDILKEYNIDKEDYNVVKTAIRNHNKYEIEPNLTHRELLFSKMIRDCDKLDIIYALSSEKLKEIVKEDEGEIHKKVSEGFFKEKQVIIPKDYTLNDKIVIFFAFAYDINFDIILNIIKANDYYNRIYERLHHRELFKPYIDKLNEYLNKRVM